MQSQAKHALSLLQGSPEWLAFKCGRIGSSQIADLTAKTKSGWGASRANLMGLLIAERLTGKPLEGYTNAAMQWGTETEPRARAAYAFEKLYHVDRVGFVCHPSIDMAGCSPDGLIGSDLLVEIKCPLTSTHIETLLGGSIPSRYISQMQWQMACTERLFCDFVSFDPRMPDHMQLFCKRLTRDDTHIATLEKEVRAFLTELDDKIAQLKSRFATQEAAE